MYGVFNFLQNSGQIFSRPQIRKAGFLTPKIRTPNPPIHFCMGWSFLTRDLELGTKFCDVMRDVDFPGLVL